MRRRKKGDLREAHGRLVAEHQEAVAALAVAEREAAGAVQRVAAARALGEVEETHARDQRLAIASELQAHRDRVDEVAQALPEIERRAAEEEGERHRAALRAASNALGAALAGRYGASRALQRAIREVELAVDELERHRGLVTTARDKYADLLGEDNALVWPEAKVDEEWSASDTVLDFLADGPVQPLADQRAAAAKAESARVLADSQVLSWFHQWPNNVRRSQLPPHLRDSEEVERIISDYDAKLAEQKRRQKEREQERKLART